MLRQTLAPLLGLPPEQLLFGREAKGRPFLRHADAPDFNLSDTGGGSLIAICRSARVGADLERVDRQLPFARLSKRWFHADESAALAAMPSEAARAAFLRLWTAKEASCKCTGTGIFGFLAPWRFDAAEETPTLIAAPEDAGASSRWSFLRIAPSPAHTAVIALRDAGPLRLSGFTLSE